MYDVALIVFWTTISLAIIGMVAYRLYQDKKKKRENMPPKPQF